jgi:hypothetical protein
MTEIFKGTFWFILGLTFGIIIDVPAHGEELKPLVSPKSTIQPLKLPKPKNYYIYDDKGNTKYITVYPLGKKQKMYDLYDFKTQTWEHGIIEND